MWFTGIQNSIGLHPGSVYIGTRRLGCVFLTDWRSGLGDFSATVRVTSLATQDGTWCKPKLHGSLRERHCDPPYSRPRDRQQPRLLASCIPRCVDHYGPHRVDDITGWLVDLDPEWYSQAGWIRVWTSSDSRLYVLQTPATSVPQQW